MALTPLSWQTYQRACPMTEAYQAGQLQVPAQRYGVAGFVGELSELGITAFWLREYREDAIFGERFYFDGAELRYFPREYSGGEPLLGISAISGNSPLLPLVLEIR
jgi:hypothetical protein